MGGALGCLEEGGTVLVLLSRLNGGQAWQACGLIHATRLFTVIQGERLAMTSAQPATPAWRVCACARARVCDGGFVWGSALNPAHCVFSHGNKWGGPFNTLPHLQWDEQRVQGVQRIYHKKKLFRVTLWSCPHPPTRLSKNKHVIFCLQFVLVEILFPEQFLKGIGSKRII